jgi:Ca2+/Na+ antiporter
MIQCKRRNHGTTKLRSYGKGQKNIERDLAILLICVCAAKKTERNTRINKHSLNLCLVGAAVVLALTYVLFMKKYYHLHEEYLASLKK